MLQCDSSIFLSKWTQQFAGHLHEVPATIEQKKAHFFNMVSAYCKGGRVGCQHGQNALMPWHV